MENIMKDKEKIILNIKNYTINLLAVLCIANMITNICDAGKEYYSTLKDIQYANAFLYLALFFFIVQKVRLLNWQSLVATLIYLPFGYAYKYFRVGSPDLFNCDKYMVWIIWLLLMIIVDMLLYHKYNATTRFYKTSLLLYVLMTVFLLYFRNGTKDPIMLALFGVYFLVPMNREKWREVINQICYGWLLAFVIILYRSLKNNPNVSFGNGRWYGDFINIGEFGLFMGCVMAVILYKLYQIKKEKTRKSFEYVIWLISLMFAIWVTCRVSTVTLFIGIGCILLMGFIAIRKDATIKNVLYKLTFVVIGLLIVGILGILVLKALAGTNEAYWDSVLREGNAFLKPVANIIKRAHYMFGKERTFSHSEIFASDSIINYIDLFASGRLSIIKVFSEYFNFSGNPTNTFMVGTYPAGNTHNAYTQMIFWYGYIGGALFISWIIYLVIKSVGLYIRTKKIDTVFPCVWMAMVLGVLLGEIVNFYWPIMVSTLLISYPVMIKITDEECDKA